MSTPEDALAAAYREALRARQNAYLRRLRALSGSREARRRLDAAWAPLQGPVTRPTAEDDRSPRP